MKKWVLVVLAMFTIVSLTQAQAIDLLSKCDYNKNWIIDGRTYLKDLKKQLKSDWDYSDEDKQIYKVALTNAKKERKCKTEIDKQETAQMKQEIAQKKIYLAQLDMSIENLRNELKKVEEELAKNISDREKKRKWLIEQIKKLRNEPKNW